MDALRSRGGPSPALRAVWRAGPLPAQALDGPAACFPRQTAPPGPVALRFWGIRADPLCWRASCKAAGWQSFHLGEPPAFSRLQATSTFTAPFPWVSPGLRCAGGPAASPHTVALCSAPSLPSPSWEGLHRGLGAMATAMGIQDSPAPSPDATVPPQPCGADSVPSGFTPARVRPDPRTQGVARLCLEPGRGRQGCSPTSSRLRASRRGRGGASLLDEHAGRTPTGTVR